MEKRFRAVSLLVVVTALVTLLYSVTQLSFSDLNRIIRSQTYTTQWDAQPDEPLTMDIVIARNKLSRELNEMRKQLGQMQCEKNKGQTSKQGGWCKSASKENSGQHVTDKKLVKELSEFLKGKRVGSFGDGPGAYKREIKKLGQVSGYDAYDGAPYCEETSGGLVNFMDLTIPQYGIPLYDWIMSLEVAEHIPNQHESIYLDNIFRHSKEGIILSWAVPGQGGLSHINNKPFKYVKDVMKSNGFRWDEELSKRLKKSSSLWWLQKNMNVYVRENFSKFINVTNLEKWYT